MATTKVKLTRDEKRAALEAEQRAARIAEFQTEIARERAKRVYSREVAWAENSDRTVQAIAELVYEFESTETRLRQLLARVAEKMTEAGRRLDAGDSPSWSTTLLGDTPADLEQSVAKRQTLRDTIMRLAWATNWYVPQVLTVRERAKHDLLVSLDVVIAPTVVNAWAVCRKSDVTAWQWLHVVDGVADWDSGATPQSYESEETAWLAAMHVAGARR